MQISVRRQRAAVRPWPPNVDGKSYPARERARCSEAYKCSIARECPPSSSRTAAPRSSIDIVRVHKLKRARCGPSDHALRIHHLLEQLCARSSGGFSVQCPDVIGGTARPWLAQIRNEPQTAKFLSVDAGSTKVRIRAHRTTASLVLMSGAPAPNETWGDGEWRTDYTEASEYPAADVSYQYDYDYVVQTDVDDSDGPGVRVVVRREPLDCDGTMSRAAIIACCIVGTAAAVVLLGACSCAAFLLIRRRRRASEASSGPLKCDSHSDAQPCDGAPGKTLSGGTLTSGSSSVVATADTSAVHI